MKALYIATCNLRHDSRFHDHNPIVEVSGKCLYRNGDFSIYKHQTRAYYLLWKNVIISEFVGINKELADALASGTKPTESPQKYHYESCLRDIADAQRYADEYHFTIS